MVAGASIGSASVVGRIMLARANAREGHSWRSDCVNTVMLPLNVASTKTCDVKDLSPGQFFFHATSGELALAVAMERKENHSPWLNLSGAAAFRLDSSVASRRKMVFALGVDPEAVRLRIAHTSAPVGYSDHILGQLIFDSEDGPSIATGCPDGEYAYDRHTAVVGSWRISQVNDGRLGVVDDWALSMVDEAGEWVDLVRRYKRL